MERELEFKIGTRSQRVAVPEEALLGVLEPNEIAAPVTGEAAVRQALASPIGTPRLRDLVRPGEKIAIVTSDITRPMPTWVVMPPLLEELYSAGRRTSPWSSPWAAIGPIRRRSSAIWRGSRPSPRSPVWTPM